MDVAKKLHEEKVNILINIGEPLRKRFLEIA